MHDSDIRAQLQRLFTGGALSPPTPAALGCDICAAVGQPAWVSRRRVQAEALIRDRALDHPEIRFMLLQVSSDLCNLCRGCPEQEEDAALRARALFLTAILPPCAGSPQSPRVRW